MAAPRLLGIAMATVATVALSSCTYADREPGLFGTRDPSAPATVPTTFAPEPPNPDLPVVGTRTWTTGEGLRVSVLLHRPIDPRDYPDRKALSLAIWTVVAEGAARLRQNRPAAPMGVPAADLARADEQPASA